MSYYGVSWVPWLVFDGKYDARQDTEDPATWMRTAFDSLLAVPSPVRINLTQHPSADWDSVYVSFDVVAVDPIPVGPNTTGIAVFLAVTEEGHRYPFPTLKWRYAFRDFVPGSAGYPITLAQGDSLHFDWAYRIDPVYNRDQIFTNIFVQLTDVVDDAPIVNILQAASARVVDVASVPPTDTQAFVWLGQNAPNPFTSDTRIAYELGRAGAVRLEVYTPTGRLVTTLVDKYLEPGPYSAAWNGLDSAGHAVGSGVYYYQLDVAGTHRSGRMVVLK